ncbi:MAG: hypothetical protein JXX14_25320 [Deltaproteobacteria bacterium]|nr:hypothetical protein [Deltaproteobacteria bacterium]
MIGIVKHRPNLYTESMLRGARIPQFNRTLSHIASWCVVLLLFPSVSLGAELLILSSPQSEARNLQLQISIDAQLMDYDAASELMVTDKIPTSDESAIAGIHIIQQQTDSLAVMWLNETSFFLYINSRDETHFFTRQLPDTAANWEVQCDAIAAVVQAILSPWLTPAPDAPPIPVNGEPETQNPTASDAKNNQRQISTPKAPRLISSKTDRRLTVHPGIGAAHTTYLMSTNNMWSHGAEILLNLQLGSRFILGAESGLSMENNRNFRMLRIPIRIRAEIFVEMPSFCIGLGTSFVLDATRISSDTHPDLNNTGHVYPGVGASLSFTYKVNTIFSVFVRGGADIYQASNKYWYNDALIFFYGQTQGRTVAGIIFWLR